MQLRLTVSALLLSLCLAAQEKIDTDRPDQTESTVTVPKGWLQFEAGVGREQYSFGALYTLPTLLSKYGVSSRFELRLILENNDFYYDKKLTDSAGFAPLTLGFKWALAEEKGILPKISLIAHSGINRMASRYYKDRSFFSPNFRFTLQHTLTPTISLGYNIGAEWDDLDDAPSWIYTLAPGINIGERWYAYIEAFGSFRKGEEAVHNADAGIAYFLNKNMKVDFSGGIPLSANSFDNYVAVGFSYRLPVRKTAGK